MNYQLIESEKIKLKVHQRQNKSCLASKAKTYFDTATFHLKLEFS